MYFGSNKWFVISISYEVNTQYKIAIIGKESWFVYTKNTNLNNNNNECKNHASLLKLTKKSNEGTGNRVMLINTADFRDNVKNF